MGSTPGGTEKPRSPRAMTASRPPLREISSDWRRRAAASTASGSHSERRRPWASRRTESYAESPARSVSSSGSLARIEQLRWIGDVVHVLVLLEPDHERTGARTHRVVFAQDGPIRVRSGGQRVQGNTRVGWGDGALVGLSRAFHDERVDVHVADVPVHRQAGGYPLARDDQRHPGRFLVHRRLAPQATRSEIVAVIAGVEHPGTLGQPRGFEGRQHLADLLVQERAKPPVARQAPAHLVFAVEVIVVVVGAGVIEEERVTGSFVLRILLRPGQVVALVVPIEVLGRHGQRKVRATNDTKSTQGLSPCFGACSCSQIWASAAMSRS